MIKVLLFAGLAEQAGTPVIELDEKETAVSAVKTLLKERYGLQTIDNAMIAINETYVKDNSIVTEGDTIAFIPPVSGG
ncbi:molybdopterin converting factor subunit 1 [Bacillus amyloliquefaciens]|uniref:molybdopterin converting factor subunit 1 n=1 Tax=Bacillus amyloliquefaciens group TaxID=1938374 RepID=UPI001E40C6DD|nr:MULTISPECIES: molybdopterin converting factor subunit 1 [Bacillus amyloliquefaciens group]MCC8307573.1 molybdopterin converting factor subunit 1 [Bacillus velezensis]MCC8311338.1 molybdopterin converting factor subunit 1 [Bacillus velezensis]MCD5426560.1 molybdopterin converting factor subunit 1 [Bacillus amyloliquefaciens]MCO7133177.1 molybdopterin converting factor subunit 1 [Bacillus velezensis]MCO7139208.1 molybdopterin converting factor subunit 1 [Bacillus velezensis]